MPRRRTYRGHRVEGPPLGPRARRRRDLSGDRGALAGPELPVPGVAKTRDDVALVVEALVERGDVDRHVGVALGQRLHALGRGDDPDVLDPLRAPALEDVDRRRRGAAGREHGVQHEAHLDGRGRRQLGTRSGVIPGTGKRRVRSRTSAATSFATVSSPFACRIRPMSAPIRSISASRMPRVVTAGVPMRMPDAIAGLFGSYGIVFLFTVIPTASSAFSATLPVRPSGRTSTSMRWLSVPPDTRRSPAFASDAARVRAFVRICFAYALNSGVAASFSITALPAITCMSGPPWTFGNTALSIAFA